MDLWTTDYEFINVVTTKNNLTEIQNPIARKAHVFLPYIDIICQFVCVAIYYFMYGLVPSCLFIQVLS